MNTTFTFNSIAKTEDTLELIEEQKATIISFKSIVARLNDALYQETNKRVKAQAELVKYKTALESIVGGELPGREP